MDLQRTDPASVLPAARARGGVGRVRTLLVIAITAVVLVAVSVLADGGPGAGEAAGAVGGLTPVDLTGTATGAAPVVGKLAPDFTATDIDGKPVVLSALAGRPVWVTFGASWCQPCRAENPDLVAAYERHRANGLVVVQIYMSESASTEPGTVGWTYEVANSAVQYLNEHQSVTDTFTVTSVDGSASETVSVTIDGANDIASVGDDLVETVDAALASWIGGPPALCIFGETCGNALAMEHNGDLYACDHYVRKDHLLGNIRDKTIGEMIDSDFQREFGRKCRISNPRNSCRNTSG